MTVTISFIFKSNPIKSGTGCWCGEGEGWCWTAAMCPPARGAVLVNNNRLIAMH